MVDLTLSAFGPETLPWLSRCNRTQLHSKVVIKVCRSRADLANIRACSMRTTTNPQKCENQALWIRRSNKWFKFRSLRQIANRYRQRTLPFKIMDINKKVRHPNSKIARQLCLLRQARLHSKPFNKVKKLKERCLPHLFTLTWQLTVCSSSKDSKALLTSSASNEERVGSV